MKVYRAETGKQIIIHTAINSLDSLKYELERATGVLATSQILMTGSGLQLKAEMINDMLRTSNNDKQKIYLFNRDILDSRNPNNARDINSLIEGITLEPPITASPELSSLKVHLNTSDALGAINFFQMNHSQGQSILTTAKYHSEICERLFQEQKNQLMAIVVALTNLSAHLVEAHEAFYKFAEKEISSQEISLQSFPTCLETLRHIKIHPEILNSSGVVSNKDSHSLADYVSQEQQLLTLARKGLEEYEQLSKRVIELSDTIRSIKLDTEELIKKRFDNEMENSMNNNRTYCDKIQQISEKLERDITRVQTKMTEALHSKVVSKTKIFEAIENLASYQLKDYLPEIQKYDEYIRERIRYFMKCKSNMTKNLISNLQEISRLESAISGIPNIMSLLDSEIRSKGQKYLSLHQVHQMPIAYAITLVEIVRRKEFIKLLLSKSQQFAEVMSEVRNFEQRRRDNYRLEIKKYVPIDIPALDDSPPICEVTTVNSDNRLPSFSKDDIQSFLNMIIQIRPLVMSQASFLRSSNILSTKTRQQLPPIDPLSTLQSKLIQLLGQIDSMNVEFENNIHESYAMDRNFKEDMNPSSNSKKPSFLRLLSKSSIPDESKTKLASNTEIMYIEKTKELEKANEKLLAYESRIKSLENLLETNFKASKASELSNPDLIVHESSQAFEKGKFENISINFIKEQENLKSEWESKHSALVTQMKVLENELEARKKELETTNTELDSKKNELDVTIAKLDTQNKKLEAKNAELDVRNQEWEATNAELIARIKELEAYNTGIGDQKKEIETSNANLNVRNQELESLNKELTTRIKNLESSNAELTARTKELEASNTKIDDQKKELETSNTKIDDQKKELEASNYKLASQIKELEASNVKLTSQIKESEAVNAQLAAQKKVFADSTVELDAQMKKLNASNAELAAQMKKIKASNSELAAYKKDLKVSNAELDSKIKKVEDLNAGLMADKEKLEAKCSEITMKKNELENQLMQDIKGWKDQFGRMFTAHEESQRDLDRLREKIKNLEQERNEFTRILSKELWNYFHNTRTLMRDLELPMPVTSDRQNFISLTPIDDDQTKATESNLSDSYHVDDLDKFFASDFADEQIWPKDRYETLVTLTSKVNLAKINGMIRKMPADAKALAAKEKKSKKQYKEKYEKISQDSKEKLTFKNFKVGDLALFLPTRFNNNWSAFNVKNHFLRVTDKISERLNRDHIVAQITEITEYIANNENPFGLTNGIKYYLLDVEIASQGHSIRRHSRSGSQPYSPRSEISNIDIRSSTSKLNYSYEGPSTTKQTNNYGSSSKLNNDHIPISSSPSHEQVCSNSEQNPNSPTMKVSWASYLMMA
ncbi:3546_t:CDS:10 [Diversispora eburnea]|uniref:Autophagy-related protein 11 n=1 Tax=Diversispora eburnea TaxID=1213867 RepID=A0A9N8YZS6_9GLOM|nr:3546_t:CDS:10 [Diversispora eburnea]